MSYHKKLKETLPLLSSFGVLLVIGVAVLSLSEAGAALITDNIENPPSDAVETTTTETTTEITVETIDAVAANTEADTVTDAKLISAPSNAAEADALKHIYVETTEPGVYNHAYFAANQVVDARGTFNNDVYVAGDTVTITGSVAGNIFAAGNTVTIDASVAGSVWVAGNTVVINDAVEQNVNVFGSNVTLTKSGYVGKDLMIGAANTTIAGFVMGQVTGGGEHVTITGHIHQHVTLDEVDTLTLDDEAWIGGNLTYEADQATTVPKNVLGGTTIFTQSDSAAAEQDEDEAAADSDFSVSWFLIKLIIGLAGYLLLGFVLLKLWPKPLTAVVQTMRTRPGKSLGYGALYLLIAPPVTLLAALTLIGFPLAVAGGLLFLLSLLIGKIAVGFALGQILLKKNARPFAQFALGFSLLYIVFKVLCADGIVGFIIVSIVAMLLGSWALGALVQYCKHKHE